MPALIVTAELAPTDFAWIDRMRQAHYPPERNHVAAHLTIFHSLPPSAEAEIRSRLAQLATGRPPAATVVGVIDLGGGVALRVASEELDRIRDELANDFHGLLGAQDSGGWRPHITIQNKVAPKVARALLASLAREFRPRPLAIAGLGLNRYLAPTWEKVAVYSFRG